MRANPKVCIEIDEIASESEWVSVIVNGHYQELPEPQYADERAHARKLLEKRYLWWQNALGERQVKSGEEFFGLFAVTAMLVCYALEARSRWFILAFAGACALGSLYGFLQGAWPFGLVEAVWSVVAIRRWALAPRSR